MSTQMRPRWAAELWCVGLGDEICAYDMDLPVGRLTRWFWRIRGATLTALFGWWWWE